MLSDLYTYKRYLLDFILFNFISMDMDEYKLIRNLIFIVISFTI